MLWLWRDTDNPVRLADHAYATFWFVLPSLPMFLLIPVLLRRGHHFLPALVAGCVLTIVLYVVMTWALARTGARL
jgi:drug/metabolite transporter (DMT)-like permease